MKSNGYGHEVDNNGLSGIKCLSDFSNQNCSAGNHLKQARVFCVIAIATVIVIGNSFSGRGQSIGLFDREYLILTDEHTHHRPLSRTSEDL